MKKIGYSEKFKKRFEVLHKKIRERFYERLDLFLKDPRHPLLKNHKLQGTYLGYWAFSVTGDIRVVYCVTEEGIKFMNIGTHNQVY